MRKQGLTSRAHRGRSNWLTPVLYLNSRVKYPTIFCGSQLTHMLGCFATLAAQLSRHSIGKHELTASRKGVADEQLARTAEERGRKRQRNGSGSRSGSSATSASVSSISTNRSISAAPSPPRRAPQRDRGATEIVQDAKTLQNASNNHPQSATTGTHSSNRDGRAEERKVRRKLGSTSPAARGRRRSRSRSSDAGSPGYRRSHHSRSPYRSRSAQRAQRSYQHKPDGPKRLSRREEDKMDTQGIPAHHNRPRPRGLSPFSRRLALTQAMNSRG